MGKGSGEQIASVNHVSSRDRNRSASETSQCTGPVAKKWLGIQSNRSTFAWIAATFDNPATPYIRGLVIKQQQK